MKRVIAFDNHRSSEHSDWLKDRFQNHMRTLERRKHLRLKQSMQVRLRKERPDPVLEGYSINVSQGGAFIKFNNLKSFEVRDRAVIAFLLPPEFTGQDKTIGLQGDAVIARVDEENQGIGLEFTINFRRFEPINVSDISS